MATRHNLQVHTIASARTAHLTSQLHEDASTHLINSPSSVSDLSLVQANSTIVFTAHSYLTFLFDIKSGGKFVT